MSEDKQFRASMTSVPALLITESKAEFEDFQGQLTQEIRPRGVIERMFVSDVAALTWDISRLQRAKTAIINLEFVEALKLLMLRLLSQHNKIVPHERIHHLARHWFTDKTARREVLELLEQFGLDEQAIEAESIKGASEDLTNIDRMLTLLEIRRSKALRSIATYREDFAARLQQRSDLVIEQGGLVRLAHNSSDRDGD